MPARRRLPPEQRHRELVEVGAALFADRPYDDVGMDQVAERAGVSRALLYRYFPSKRALFAAVYRRAADDLLDATRLDPDAPIADQVTAGLDAHLDYFTAHRHTVLAANRTLAGDPVVGTIIADEMAELRRRLVETSAPHAGDADLLSATVLSWLVFVRTLCVDWLATMTTPRDAVRDVCLGALLGALAPMGRQDVENPRPAPSPRHE